VLLELLAAGAVGWIAGYPNALPVSCMQLYRTRDPELYRLLHPLLRWDSKTGFVQAIKLSMDLAGRYGGPCRPPRLPLNEAAVAAIKQATETALAKGCR
jgi:4-hydroxy-tetrahydrodipicolinate synthase